MAGYSNVNASASTPEAPPLHQLRPVATSAFLERVGQLPLGVHWPSQVLPCKAVPLHSPPAPMGEHRTPEMDGNATSLANATSLQDAAAAIRVEHRILLKKAAPCLPAWKSAPPSAPIPLAKLPASSPSLRAPLGTDECVVVRYVRAKASGGWLESRTIFHAHSPQAKHPPPRRPQVPAAPTESLSESS